MIGDGARSRLAGTRFSDIRSLGSLGSTNRHLLDLARAGAPDGVVVVADHQRQGRGRMGRSWVAPAGTSLLVSVLLRAGRVSDQLHLGGMVMGLAVADACQAEGGVAVWLKWPNDVTHGGRKLAGVLAEACLDGPRVAGVVVGAGVNVDWPAADERPRHTAGCASRDDLGGTAVSLSHLAARPIDKDQLLAALLGSLERRWADLETPAGRRAQVLEYRHRCATLGRLVRVEMVGESFTGTAVDVSPEGELLVDVGVCLRQVSAADVVHVRPPAGSPERPTGSMRLQ